MERAHAALAVATYPKLLFAGDPGALVPTTVAEGFARRLSNCRLVKLGSGLHYLQEDHPGVIAREVVAFIAEVEARTKGEAAAGSRTAAAVRPCRSFSRVGTILNSGRK
jgi:haloalkane dehalogenase